MVRSKNQTSGNNVGNNDRNNDHNNGHNNSSKRATAPSTTIHQTYNHLSKIKPKKARRSINANLKHVEQIALKTLNKKGLKTVGEMQYPSADTVSIDSFTILDSTNKKFILAFDESEPSLRIFAKASRQFAKQRLGAPENIEITRTFAGEIVEAKPEVV
eukprot:jgi/Psemu1/36774/gm1.36774_g